MLSWIHYFRPCLKTCFSAKIWTILFSQRNYSYHWTNCYSHMHLLRMQNLTFFKEVLIFNKIPSQIWKLHRNDSQDMAPTNDNDDDNRRQKTHFKCAHQRSSVLFYSISEKLLLKQLVSQSVNFLSLIRCNERTFSLKRSDRLIPITGTFHLNPKKQQRHGRDKWPSSQRGPSFQVSF